MFRPTHRSTLFPYTTLFRSWFPDPFSADTWNFNAINPWVTNFNIGIHKGRRTPDRQNLAGWWVQDDWRMSNKWTLRSEENTSELQSHSDLVCRLLLQKKKQT